MKEKVQGSGIPYTLRVDCAGCMISYLPRTRIAVRGGTVFPPKFSSLIRTSKIGTALSSAHSSPGLAQPSWVNLCQHQLQWSVPELDPNDVRHTILFITMQLLVTLYLYVLVYTPSIQGDEMYESACRPDDCPG